MRKGPNCDYLAKYVMRTHIKYRYMIYYARYDSGIAFRMLKWSRRPESEQLNCARVTYECGR